MDRRLRIAGNMSADPTTNDPDLEAGDEPYDSAEDEDFELDATGQDEESEPSSDSDAEDDVGRGQPAKKKRKTGTRGKKDAGVKEDELDSGDEATIQKAKERKKKRTQKQKGQQAKGKAGGSDDEDDEEDVDFDEDEEGDTGGFVRTRAMKMRTYVTLSMLPCYYRDRYLLILLATDKKSENLWPRLTAQPST